MWTVHPNFHLNVWHLSLWFQSICFKILFQARTCTCTLYSHIFTEYDRNSQIINYYKIGKFICSNFHTFSSSFSARISLSVLINCEIVNCNCKKKLKISYSSSVSLLSQGLTQHSWPHSVNLYFVTAATRLSLYSIHSTALCIVSMPLMR
jgi:hypothetical protein